MKELYANDLFICPLSLWEVFICPLSLWEVG